jgi:hypothetical protein
MTVEVTIRSGPDWHKIQQRVKWVVYALLIVNFVFYIFEDATSAVHTLTASSTFLDWTGTFATSIDESAWFLLLAMYEIETYVVDDEDLTGWVATLVHGIRLVCFVLIAHTIYAFLIVVMSLQATVTVEGISSLCDMADANVSYVYNVEYTEINEQNCDSLSSSSQFYWLASDPVVSDMQGLALERDLALADLAEAVIWLLILMAIEVVVRSQGHGITGGRLIATAKATNMLLYASLIALGVYWAALSHWLYLWDELVWIGGFAAIEMNLSEWRNEIVDKQHDDEQ